ncbi:unnamed protein product [Parajaminaea phylloscopi]
MSSVFRELSGGSGEEGLLDRRRSSGQTIRRTAGIGSVASSKRSTRLFQPSYRSAAFGARDSHSLLSSSRNGGIRVLQLDSQAIQAERSRASASQIRSQDEPRAMLTGDPSTASCTRSVAAIPYPQASTSISQRLRRAIIEDDLPMARSLAKQAAALCRMDETMPDSARGHHIGATEPFTLQGAANRAWERQKSMLNPAPSTARLHPFKGTATSSERPGSSFCIRNVQASSADTTSSHASSRLANLTSYSRYQDFSQDHLPRDKLAAELDTSRSSLELAVVFGCSIDLIEWLLDMGHEDGCSSLDASPYDFDLYPSVSFTHDQLGRTIPHLAAVHNRPDVISLYCSHIHFVLSLPRTLSLQPQTSRSDGEAPLSGPSHNHLPDGEIQSGPTTRPPSRHREGREAPAYPNSHVQPWDDPKRPLQAGYSGAMPNEEDAGQMIAALLDSSPAESSMRSGSHEQPSYRSAHTHLNILPNHSRSALHDAAMRGLDSVITVLLELGADPQRLDAYGNTALHYASSYGHLTTLQLLIEAPIRDQDSPMIATAAHPKSPDRHWGHAHPSSPPPSMLSSEQGNDTLRAFSQGPPASSTIVTAERSIFAVKNDGGFSAADFAYTFGDKAALEALGRRWFAENREETRRRNRQAAEQAAAATSSAASTSGSNASPEMQTAMPLSPRQNQASVAEPQSSPPRPSSAGLIREHLPHLPGSGLLRSAANTVAAKRAALTGAASDWAQHGRESRESQREREANTSQAAQGLLTSASMSSLPLTTSSGLPSAQTSVATLSPPVTSSPLRNQVVTASSSTPSESRRGISLFNSSTPSGVSSTLAGERSADSAVVAPSPLSGVIGSSTGPSNPNSLRRRGSALERIKNGAKEVMHISRGTPASSTHPVSPASSLASPKTLFSEPLPEPFDPQASTSSVLRPAPCLAAPTSSTDLDSAEATPPVISA